MLKKYKMGFELWSVVLFLVVMMPTFLWLAFPAPKDVLRGEGTTQVLDTIASISQMLMVAALCLFSNREGKKLAFTRLIFAVLVCVLLYYICWGIYYCGIVNAGVVLGLCLFPCLAFLCFAFDRKNGPALVPAIVFTLCHLLHGIVNYMH